MDLRVEKTYKALVDAFTGLVGDMPLEDVTVALLCDRALVRRTTFYRHFADKDEFVRFYILSMRDEIEARALAGEGTPSTRDYLVSITRELGAFCLEHAHMVDNVLGGSSFGALFNMMGDVVRRMLVLRLEGGSAGGAASGDGAPGASAGVPAGSTDVPAGSADVPGVSVDALATFVAGGVMQTVLTWWHSGHASDTDVAAGLDVLLDRLLP